MFPQKAEVSAGCGSSRDLIFIGNYHVHKNYENCASLSAGQSSNRARRKEESNQASSI